MEENFNIIAPQGVYEGFMPESKSDMAIIEEMVDLYRFYKSDSQADCEKIVLEDIDWSRTSVSEFQDDANYNSYLLYY